MSSVALAVVAAAGGLAAGGVAGAVAAGRAAGRAGAPPPDGTSAGADTGVLPPGATDVLDALRGATVVLDRDDRVLRASPTAHLLGLVSGERLVVDRLAAAVDEVRRRGDHRDVEVRLSRGRTGGGERDVVAEVVPLGRGLVLVVAQDVTEARRAEAVRRDFAANVSHELKTPVGALSLLAEAVADAADDPEAVARFAGRMRVEADRLTQLVNEVVELSRLQDPGRPLALEDVPVDDVVDEAVDAVRTAALARGVAVDRTGATGVRVRAERSGLVTAVRNLLANAVAYSPEGTRVEVAVRADHGRLEIDVADQGVGIPPAEHERVFERFYRVDPARSRSSGGSGLGLAIVKHVAARHGGEVGLRSAEGEGSTFTLRLPLEDRS